MRPVVGALVGLLALALAACQRPAPPPTVVVVLLDTLRADRLGCYGNDQHLTPYLDQLAERGVRFERAWGTSSWTMPSVASLFTSRYPSQHGVQTMESRLADGETTLAEVLAARGWAAAGFSANLLVGAPHGFGQGFDPWLVPAVETPTDKVRGPRLRADGARWLDQQPAGGRPLLLYYQFMEPHAPYDPPEPYRGRHVRAHAPGDVEAAAQVMAEHKIWNRPAEQIALLASLYDGEVAAADEEVRLLFADLERRGLLANAVVVITADHGEEFGERGALSHGFTLFEEQVRVPLIVLAPGLAPAVVRQPVSLVDVAPTLLELVGVPAPPAFEGRSLVPLMRGAAAPPVELVAELEAMGPRKAMRKHQQALLRGDHKLLRSPNPFIAPQVFDLATDPGERQPDPPALADEREAMLGDLDRLVARLAERASPASAPVELDAATREKLRALGYGGD
ncbi:sulfatase-like hydrolase/transferase [bacterium]|nr:sulfatase-like hydrolase/transferase [bacterium]